VSESNRSVLHATLIADYDGFARRLASLLGSPDLAREALHETFLRIEGVSEMMAILSPEDYIFRTAINVAKDRYKRDRRLLSAAEIGAICDIPDDRPDPSMVVEGRLDLRDLNKALAELPERRRAAFLAAHIEQIPHSEIAGRLGVNIRTVEFDLQYAMEHLSRRLGRKLNRRFGPRTKVAPIE
jgi:RNA polymerase sigma-70 factor (ECF subfamily)